VAADRDSTIIAGRSVFIRVADRASQATVDIAFGWHWMGGAPEEQLPLINILCCRMSKGWWRWSTSRSTEYIAAARFDTEMVYQSDVLVVPVQGGLGIRWRHLSGYEAPEANQILKARMKCMLTPSTGCHVGEGKI
jgi:hypothetical protein